MVKVAHFQLCKYIWITFEVWLEKIWSMVGDALTGLVSYAVVKHVLYECGICAYGLLSVVLLPSQRLSSPSLDLIFCWSSIGFFRIYISSTLELWDFASIRPFYGFFLHFCLWVICACKCGFYYFCSYVPICRLCTYAESVYTNSMYVCIVCVLLCC